MALRSWFHVSSFFPWKLEYAEFTLHYFLLHTIYRLTKKKEANMQSKDDNDMIDIKHTC